MKDTLVLEDFFASERCDECGMCLYRCPTLRLSLPEARAEVGRLLRGEPARFIDGRCASCYSCSTWCPRDCNPYGLIIYRWYERYLRRGLPVRALLAMPLEEVNNTSIAMRHHTPRERRLVEEWKRTANDPERVAAAGGEVVFAGCNARMYPCLLDTSLLEGMAVLGERELCCGEVYYRLGLFDPVRRQVPVLEERFRRLGVKRMVFFCAACYNVITNVLPRHFGARFDFETEYLGERLLGRVERGELEFAPLEARRAVVSDACHAKVLGREFMEAPRSLLRAMGLETVEMPHSREQSVCCGAACGARGYNPVDMGLQALKQWDEARASGADLLVAYCATCLLLLSIGRLMRPTRMPLRHLMELAMESVGEEPPHDLIARRARFVFTRIMARGIPRMLSARRVDV